MSEQQILRKTVEELITQVRQQYLNSIKSLALALEARDSYTQGHSLRVTQYSLSVAEHLSLPKYKKKQLHLAGLLHDIGKIGVKKEVLNKPDKLTPEQYEQIKTHPLLAIKILRPVITDEDILEMIRHHHESWDGKGYPDGIKGEEISLGARIMQVCDTFDAITSDRPYRKARPKEIAFEELIRCSGSQFDPYIVRTFLKISEETLDKIENQPLRSLLSNVYDAEDELIDIFSDALIT
jgi:putative two-component system response regulator